MWRKLIATPARLSNKIRGQVRVLRSDPERFARNIMQVTHKDLFEERLLDVMDAVPMHVRVDPALAGQPYLNVLSSALTKDGMTGGPNTLLNLAARIAQQGVNVRLVTTVKTSTLEEAWFAAHAAKLLGVSSVPRMPIVSAADPDNPLVIGTWDVFMASHWTTAQQLKAVLPSMRVRQFFYMLQEFEPGFYSWSSNYARATETYGMDFFPVVNESLLAEHLFAQPFGRLPNPETRHRATVFEPAIEDRLFHPPAQRDRDRRPRLLFYARPTNARNMFGLGLMALREAVRIRAFHGWEFLSIGGRGSVPPLDIGGGHVLKPAPWMDYDGYAKSLQQADVLLCPMMSPHTSYPVLEMAACGGISVTNTFVNKTRAAMEALSPDIYAAEPTVESIASALSHAAMVTEARFVDNVPRKSTLNMATDWAQTLDPAAARLANIFQDLVDRSQCGRDPGEHA